MATPHDDDAPPAPNDTVTTADLDLVDRLDVLAATRSGAVGAPEALESLERLGTTLLPRLARAYRAVTQDRDEWKALAEDRRVQLVGARDAYARGRREAIEEAAQLFRGPLGEIARLVRGEAFDVPRLALAAAIERHEAERGSK